VAAEVGGDLLRGLLVAAGQQEVLTAAQEGSNYQKLC